MATSQLTQSEMDALWLRWESENIARERLGPSYVLLDVSSGAVMGTYSRRETALYWGDELNRDYGNPAYAVRLLIPELCHEVEA